MFFNARAAFKLLVDWKGMVTTCRFVEEAYASVESLPTEAELEHEPEAPVFVHLVPAFYEPAIADTLSEQRAQRVGDGRLHGVLPPLDEQDRPQHPAMAATTDEPARLT